MKEGLVEDGFIVILNDLTTICRMAKFKFSESP